MVYLQLFYEFFKTGLFTIGGGLATLPFLYNIADRYPWYTRGELADMIAISESTPGPIGVNMATYAGYSAGGALGGVVATTALVLPSIIVIITIAKFLGAFHENRFVKDAFYGLRPAVTALIAAAGSQILVESLLHVDRMGPGSSITQWLNWKAAALFVLLLILTNRFKKLHPVFYLAGAAVCGLLFL